MTDDPRPAAIREYEELRFVRPLASPDAARVLRVLDDIDDQNHTRAIPHLVPLLERDDPYVFTIRGTPHVTELRARVLEVLERLSWLWGELPELGPVKVRMPMPAADAIAAAHAATASLTEAARAAIAAPIDAWLATQTVASADDREAVRAFRTLQALGRIEHRLERVDPDTFITPLQQEILDGQTRSPRPRPHVRVAREDHPDVTLGWIYRKPDGLWAIDFSDAFDARDLEQTVRRIMGVPRQIRQGAPPQHVLAVERVVFGPDGQPLVNERGWLQFDGEIPLDSPDTLAILRSVHAQLAQFDDAELVL